jgi:osmotically-inducible protein OsmY
MNNLLTSLLVALGVLLQTGCAVTAEPVVDDTAITARVKSRFAQDKDLAATRIQVDTMKGTVQLTGYALSEMERARAVQIARSVPDVRDVRNEVLVRTITP